MTITDIKQQVKRRDRFSVYVSGKYACSLSQDEILRLGLRIGSELNDSDLSVLKQDAALDKARDSVLNLLARRPRSEWEVRDYLKRKDYTVEQADRIVNTLSNKGYIDDLDFARRWVESRRLLKATSKRRLVQELRAKRVADDITNQVLEADETDEAQVLKDLVAKKRTQSRYQDDQKLMQYLARQGYRYDDIKLALHDDQTI